MKNKWFDFKTTQIQNEKEKGIIYTRFEIISNYFSILLTLAGLFGVVRTVPKTLGFECGMLMGFFGILIINQSLINARNRRIKELLNAK
jgi:hypothetical protein